METDATRLGSKCYDDPSTQPVSAPVNQTLILPGQECVVSGLTSTNFADAIAAQLRAQSRGLAQRWLERLVVLLPVEVIEIFPSDQLLDHIPTLITELAEYLRVPEDQAIQGNSAVVSKAMELGELRHGQRASVHQLLREYQLLGNILAAFVQEETERLGLQPSPVEAMALLTRLHMAVSVLEQTTVDTFIATYTETIARQTDRLESFNRLVSHELRQPLTALQAAVSLITMRRTADEPVPARTVAVLERNVSRLVELTRQLEGVSRLREEDDNAQIQKADLTRGRRRRGDGSCGRWLMRVESPCTWIPNWAP